MWAVSSGSYSDYGVLFVCKSEEVAQAWADRLNREPKYDPYFVEEFPVVTADTGRVSELRLAVEIANDGTEMQRGNPRTAERINTGFPWEVGTTKKVEWRWVRAPMYRDKGGRLEVWGLDHERVRKVFSDRRAWLMSDDAARMQEEAGS